MTQVAAIATAAVSYAYTAAIAPNQEPGSIIPGTASGYTDQQTTWGPTGLINVPTAYTIGRGQASVGASFSRDRRGPTANYSPYPDIEVGGGYIERDGFDGKAIANGKVLIRPMNFRNVELGVGVIDAADAINQTFYAIGSFDLVAPDARDDVLGEAFRLKVHAGYGTGLFRDKVIGGGELSFSNRVGLVAEWDGVDANASIRYRPNDNVTMQLGVMGKNLFFGVTSVFRP